MNPERILVTGASGFVGQHLLPALQQAWPRATLQGTSRTPDASFLTLDICDAAAVSRCIADVRPDLIIHLAAQANVGVSFDQPEQTWRSNLDGTRHLLEACQQHTPQACVLVIGSADMYGATFAQGQAVDEQQPFLPLNPYAASKCAADLLAWQVSQTSTLQIIRVRAFNHIGPGQSAGYALSAFAQQIARIEAGQQAPVLSTGNLDVQRDITDVRDLVQAYIALVRKQADIASGTAFNVGSGQAAQLDELLQVLVSLSAVEIDIQQDPARMRPTDIKTVCSDVSALKNITGWQPHIDMRDTLTDLLNDWRQRVAASAPA